jgi:hypothetical protein
MFDNSTIKTERRIFGRTDTLMLDGGNTTRGIVLLKQEWTLSVSEQPAFLAIPIDGVMFWPWMGTA